MIGTTAWRAGLSGSAAGACQGPCPQPLHVARRRQAEETFVFPVEVGGVAVTDAIGRTGRIEVCAQHQAAGFLEPHLPAELQGAGGGDGFEVVAAPASPSSPAPAQPGTATRWDRP